ncbi:MAG: energy-coupling factor transporter ATPase [Acetobacter sp.]|nr:energy-coupling factor transporter ATPase [Bacteroides sp.]MCM1340482.1 energy-coupling factor transporter ATPase [Acetobacter sp.]MCM1433222.1 energy-coupling factor transporter ATPase [Clostridiales bacterium]
MAYLVCDSLKYLYSIGTPFETAALDDVNISVDEGELVGIIGHTGSGKSTLIQHFNGLLQPHKGKVFVDGKDIWSKENKKNIRQVRFAVGLCFQYPEYQIFEESVYKEIAFGPKQMGLDELDIDKRVKSSMDFVGIPQDIASQSPFDLSGGQKRRVAIASILAMQPKVLILDEPCAGLDPRGREVILELIKNYQKKMGNTVILVSHSMEDVAKLCSKVLVMNKGKVAMYGTVDEVYSHGAELKAMGLNVPEITDIFLKLKEQGIECNTNIYTVDQGVKEFNRLLGGAENDN